MRSVVIVEADDRLLREHADQLLMDGYDVHAASTAQAARIKLAEAPDALVLCSAGTPPESIGLLRELRSEHIAQLRDSALDLLAQLNLRPAGRITLARKRSFNTAVMALLLLRKLCLE